MSNLIKYLVLSVLFLVMPTLADYNPFSNVKNARELMTQARRMHFQVRFRYRPARSISQFDKVDEMHVSGRVVYAVWYNSFRMKDFTGKGIDEVRKELKNSNITSKILYTPTTSNLYNRVYRQSISPGKTIYAKGSPAHRSSSQNSSYGHYETIKVRSFSGVKTKKVWVQGSSRGSSNYSANNTPFDAQGNVLLTLYVYKYAGIAKKMIDLKGLTLQEAKSKIKKYKLPIGYIQDIYKSTTNPKLYGKIFSQTIKPGTPIVKPKYMGVQIYSMPKIKMPDLTKGWTLKKAMQNRYFIITPQYTKIIENSKNRSLNGKIYSQDVKPGTSLFRPTNIHVKVYKLIKCVFPPNVKNMSIEDAVAKLKRAGFKPKIIDLDVLNYIKKHPSVYKIAPQKVLDEKIICMAPKSTVAITRIKLKETVLPNWKDKKCDSIKSEIKKIEKRLGKVYFKIKEVENRSYKKGNILISANPKWGSTIKTFQTVELLCRKKVYLPKMRDDESIVPPDIVGKTLEDAKKEMKELGFTNVTVKKEKRVGVVDGTVLDVWGQMDNPTIGIVRSKSERMTLLVADINGKEMPIMPNILGASPEVAKSILVKKGFRDIRFESEASSYVKHITSLPAGTVIATSPRGGNKCQYGYDSTIFLTVKLKPNQKLPANVKKSKPEKSSIVKVPALASTVDATIKKIKDAGLVPKVEYVSTKFTSLNGKIKPGSTPPWGTILKRGSTVSFGVYVLHPRVPSVVAISKDTAIKIIKKAGFKEKMTYYITDNKNLDGKVKSQTPRSGTEAKSNSVVSILVYKYSNLVKVPNLVGISKQKAIDILKKYVKDLKYRVVYVYTALSTLNGKIQKTTPPYNTKMSSGSTVTLYVYKLLDKVPSVIGKTEQEAKSILEKFGFEVKKLYSKDHKANIVWYQHPKANSKLTHAAVTISVGKVSTVKPSMRKSIKLTQLSPQIKQKIEDFYRDFKEAYESKDEGRVVSFLSSDWTSASGGDISDMEDNLNRTFRVFDEIEYDISGLNIQPMGENRYRVSYNLNIAGQIYDDDITHKEKSSVQEEVLVKNGKVEIEKTLGGRYWSIK